MINSDNVMDFSIAVEVVSSLLRKGMPSLGVAMPFDFMNDEPALKKAELFEHFMKRIESDFERLNLTYEEKTQLVAALGIVQKNFFPIIENEIRVKAFLEIVNNSLQKVSHVCKHQWWSP